MIPAEPMERTIVRVLEAGHVLRAAPHERVIDALARASERLADPQSELGAKAREVLPAQTGLSPENIERTLFDSLETLQRSELERALAIFERAALGHRTMPVALAGLILAGNVFTAALRPIAWSLLLRVPALVKPSTEDHGLSELFVGALEEADPELAMAIGLVRFGRTDQAMLDRFAAQCSVLHVWGSDEAIGEIRARTLPTTAFVPHGHGLGAIYIPKEALSGLDEGERIAREIALDVSLYDQRGCLSPHVVFVMRGARVSPVDFARILGEHALAELERTMPRGSLPLEIGARQVQWRGLGAVRGELFEGATWAVTFEGNAPFRSSPGWRNVAVHEIDSLEALASLLAPLGPHLKALGVAGEAEHRRVVATTLPAGLAPRISATGEMQRPGLLASPDGERPWQGFVRIVDTE